MAIAETQLETWSHQGAIAGSADTYRIIRQVLGSSAAPYAAYNYEIFLQGSYGNDTNIYAESDVDIVIRLDSTFLQDVSALPPEQQDAYNAAYSAAPYPYAQFQADVLAQLRSAFGSSVQPGSKAIKIEASGARRNADVVVAAQFRRYQRFRHLFDESYDTGICFYTAAGQRIVNYPKQHSANCTAKQAATNRRFKPMVRVLKNMRKNMVAHGWLADGVAPSYFLEGLLYNVPDTLFQSRYADTFVGAMAWIVNADRNQFVCANEQHYLIRDTSVTWPAANAETFFAQALDYWNRSP